MPKENSCTPEYCGYIVEFENHAILWVNKKTLSVGWFDRQQTSGEGVIRFQKTKMNLFSYLLEHAGQKKVCRDELLSEVWEKNGLKSSSRQLWHAIGQLKLSLFSLGIPYEFIHSEKGKAYRLEGIKVYFISTKRCCLPAV